MHRPGITNQITILTGSKDTIEFLVRINDKVKNKTNKKIQGLLRIIEETIEGPMNKNKPKNLRHIPTRNNKTIYYQLI